MELEFACDYRVLAALVPSLPPPCSGFRGEYGKSAACVLKIDKLDLRIRGKTAIVSRARSRSLKAEAIAPRGGGPGGARGRGGQGASRHRRALPREKPSAVTAEARTSRSCATGMTASSRVSRRRASRKPPILGQPQAMQIRPRTAAAPKDSHSCEASPRGSVVSRPCGDFLLQAEKAAVLEPDASRKYQRA